MDLANKHGAVLAGTGDLSELALGWCTYNADHMSMYGVNAGVPKTLVRHLVHNEAQQLPEEIAKILNRGHSTVRSRYRRALKKLERKLQEKEESL